jgi:tRNA(Ile)-lysidine synthase
LRAGGTEVFDGRFEVRSEVEGLAMTPLIGAMARLPSEARRRLSAVHPVARAAMPALIDADGAVSCPTLMRDPRVEVRPLVSQRLAGACGMIHSEGELRREA